MTITNIKSIISVDSQIAWSAPASKKVTQSPDRSSLGKPRRDWSELSLRARTRKSLLRISSVRNSLLMLLAATVLSGCGLLDYKRIAYDFLRQEDCRRNDVDVYEFCSRTFVFEYDEYELLRQEYIRSEQDKILRDQAARERYTTIYDNL